MAEVSLRRAAIATPRYNGEMERRHFLTGLLLAPVLSATDPAGATIRGKLTKGPDDKPALQTTEGKLVLLTGDEDTLGVLRDKRLAGADFEVAGKFNTPDQFTINPIHTRAMFVHKDGKKLLVTYWCDICAIRTYTPGICWCCREETELDLREPDKVDSK